eukprot:SM000056S18010  [mRNA]  locus=s56:630241:633283:+ [translate_table: standard]
MAAAVGGGGGGGGGGRTFFLDAFAARQWDDPAYDGTVLRFDRGRFVERVHELHADGGSAPLVPGYAVRGRCRRRSRTAAGRRASRSIFEERSLRSPLTLVPSLPRATLAGAPRTSASTVLARWFPAQVVEAPEAKFLDIILYSREQLETERASSQPPESAETTTPLPDAPWGIICIKAQDVNYELPMSPITMMRNALGTAEGGSGVALDRKKYEESVEFWDSHANIIGAGWGAEKGAARTPWLELYARSKIEEDGLDKAMVTTSSMSPARSSTSSPAMRKRKRPAAMESFLSTACEW